MIPDSFFPALLNQLIQVSCVVVLAAIVTRWTRGNRPHLVHAVWLIVFLKCITPPIVASPSSPFSWLQAALVDSEGNGGVSTFYAWTSDSENQTAQPASLGTNIVTSSLTMSGNDLGELNSFGISRAWRSLRRIATSFSSIQLLLLSWLMVAGAIFAIFVFRFMTFLRWVNRTKLRGAGCDQYSERLDGLVASVEVKLGMGMHRPARVEVVDALIGPAIVGVLSPTILLPKVIVDRVSDKQLETLIAHELVHFRRGDLWWSALQTLAVCCYWFHPLVWLARSVMNREAEKCCDEETIGSLKCKPAEYARCLISVLECKHLLRAAPLLPGVRPVDITAKRLERIMRLRHGCYSQSPRWVRITLIVGAIILLPGATLSFGQQKEAKSASIKMAPVANADGPLGLAQPESILLPLLPKEEANLSSPSDKTAEKESYQPPESIDITAVLDKLQESEHVSREVATSKLLAGLPTHTCSMEMTVDVDGNSVKLGGDQPCLKILGNRLYVLGTKSQRGFIRTYLEHHRHFGNQFLVYEVRILDVPNESLEALSIRWDWEQTTKDQGEHNETTKNEVVAASFVTAHVLSKLGQLDSTQIKELLACEGCNRLSAPKVATYNAQTAKVQIGTTHPFVVGHTAVAGEDGKPSGTFQPEIEVVESGLKLELEGKVIESDPSKLAIRLRYTHTKILDVEQNTIVKDGQEQTIQMPNVSSRFMETMVEQPLGSTFAMVGEPEMVETVTERRVPIVGSIPYVSRMFKNVAKHSELRTQVVLVTCRLVGDAEESKVTASQSSEADSENLGSPVAEPKLDRRRIAK